MNDARIFIVSAQEIFRLGLVTILSNEPGLCVISEQPHLASAAELVKSCSSDLVVFDLQNADLKRDLSLLVSDEGILQTKVIAVAAASTQFEIAQCVQAGIHGIISRNVIRSEIITAIRDVLEGRDHFCSHMSSKLVREIGSRSLTRRELEVLQYLALGLSNKEIAKRLKVGVGTVKTHLININAKLEVTTRTEAVIHGVQQRLIAI